MMALPAGMNSRKQNFSSFLAGQGADMATRASHQAVLVVAEDGMRKPALDDVRFGDDWKRSGWRKIQGVTFLAGLVPEQLL